MTDYILEPLDTDTEAIYEAFVEFIQQYYPDWNPAEAQLDVLIARFFSMQVSFTADMASRVQRAIYRYLGNNLANVPPLPGSQAVVTIKFFMVEALEQRSTLPYGTFVGIVDVNGDTQVFQLLDDMIVEPGTTEAQETAQAVELGSAGNNLSGTVELIEQVDWILRAETVGASAGGSDPEEDITYLNRLTDNFALMAPRPIIANDFAVMARNVPGVWRAAAIDNYAPGINEQQSMVLNSGATGNLKLFFGGQGPSANIAWPSPTNAAIQTGLESLPNINPGDVILTGGPIALATPVIIEFTGQYAAQDVPLLVQDLSAMGSVTGSGVSQYRASAPWQTTAANTIAIGAVDELGNPIPADVEADLLEYLESMRQQNFLIQYIDPVHNTVNINYAGVSQRTADADSVKSMVDDSLAQYLNPATWGQVSRSQGSRDWQVSAGNKIRYLDLTTVIENTNGFDYLTNLDFQVGASPMDKTDKSFSGVFTLAKLGVVNGTVTQG